MTLLSFFILMVACNRAKNKGRELLDAGKGKITEKKDAVLDKVWPQFDATVPDTKNNKKRFKDFMHFEPGPDVKNLYCEDNRIGINSSFYFVFECDDSTVSKIRHELKMTKDAEEHLPGWFGLGACPMPWWDSATIVRIKPDRAVDHKVYWYLWYDQKKKTAYLETYDM